MGNHVFICYAREDEDFVFKLAANLKGRGVPVWLDQWDIPPGANWNKTIDDAIHDCAKFLIVLSPAAVESKEVEGEWLTALDENRPILPVICQKGRVPRQLRTIQYVDFTSRSPEDATVLDQVVRALGGEQPPSSPRRDEDPPRAIPSQSRREKRSWLSLSVSLIGLIAVLYLLNLLRTHPASPPREPPPVEEKPGLPSRPSPAPSQQGKDSKETASIPAGEFWMGCSKGDQECASDEKPGREVNLDAFSIDKYEVTVADYRRCVKAGKCSDQDLQMYGSCNWSQRDREDHPINCVDWNQAMAYCQWAGKRLPTEAEWEKAARAGSATVYSFGDVPSWLGEYAWYNANSGSGTHPVGQLKSNTWGLYDMAGNVWEWVHDWYADTYYQSSPGADPGGPEKGDFKVLRGGSWYNGPWDVRVSYRVGRAPGDRGGLRLGFRCAR